MPRRPRDRSPGIHHVIVGATGPSAYYRDEIDRLMWMRRLVRTLDRCDWGCLSICQMTTHVHALVDVPDESLPAGMHFLSSAYGKDFNDRHDRRGSLIRSRYWSTRMTTDEQLLAAFRYIARNPLRARMCRPEEWHWSSFATSCGLAETFSFVDASPVLALLGGSTGALLALVRGD
jgi:REP-associated tyrosine transposase